MVNSGGYSQHQREFKPHTGPLQCVYTVCVSMSVSLCLHNSDWIHVRICMHQIFIALLCRDNYQPAGALSMMCLNYQSYYSHVCCSIIQCNSGSNNNELLLMIYDSDNQTGDAICFLQSFVVVTAFTHQQTRSTHWGDGGGGVEQREKGKEEEGSHFYPVCLDGWFTQFGSELTWINMYGWCFLQTLQMHTFDCITRWDFKK